MPTSTSTLKAATSVLFAASFASVALAASEVGSPNLFECSPAAIQYSCDKPPCQIIARPADDAASSLSNFGEAKEATGTVSWRPVDQKAGTVVVLYITNADGEQATSAPLTVNNPNDAANALGSDGKCGGGGGGGAGGESSSSSAAEGETSSSASSGDATSTGAGASASSKASDAAASASSKADAATSKAGSITSSLGSKTDTATGAK
ncbi:hypothetical protein JCM11491_003535 [Sporobolomyces phaffii]